MSRLATALHAPPGPIITAKDAWFMRYQTLLDQRAQCHRAFLQDPSPRLAVALKQIQSSLNHEHRYGKRQSWI